MAFGVALGLLAGGIGKVFGGISKKQQAEARAENVLIGLRNTSIKQIQNLKNFNPFQPFGTLARGRLFGAIAKSWGLDGMVGKDIIDHIGKASNVPGTEAIGGARFQVDPQGFGLPEFEKPKAGGALAGAIGDVFGGIGMGLNSIFPKGGGAGGASGVTPSGMNFSGPGTGLDVTRGFKQGPNPFDKLPGE